MISEIHDGRTTTREPFMNNTGLTEMAPVFSSIPDKFHPHRTEHFSIIYCTRYAPVDQLLGHRYIVYKF